MALARIVMANREHIIALEPFGKGFLGTTLRYDYEVRDAKPYLGKVPSPRVDKEMVDIAKNILEARPAISIRRSSRTSTRRHSRSW